MTQIEVLRSNLLRLRDDFSAATGITPTRISEVFADDRAFYSRINRKDFRVGTYDMVAGRFSAVWPNETPWPEGIARPDAVALSDASAAYLRDYFAARADAAKKEAANG